MKNYYTPDSNEQNFTVKPERRAKLSNNRYVRIAVTIFLTFVCCCLFVYLIFNTSRFIDTFHQLNKIMTPVYTGLVIAYLLSPVVNKIENRVILPLFEKWNFSSGKRRAGIARGLSIAFSLLISFFILYGIFYLFLSQIIPSINSIIDNFDTYVTNITNWINTNTSDNPEVGTNLGTIINRIYKELEDWFNGNVMSTTTSMIKKVSLSILAFLKGVLNFAIGIIISVYVLNSKEKFIARAKKIVYSILPRTRANDMVTAFRFTHKTFSGFITGKIIDSLIIGLICFICTTIMQTPYRALVSLIIGVTNIIPFFGPWIGGIPCVILVFMVNPTHPLNALYFMIFILILQQIDGNIIGPKILGDYTGLAGFWVIFSITLFGGVFGVFGMIIGVPLFAVLYAGVRNLTYIRLKGKGMPTDTKEYLDLGQVYEDGSFEKYIPKDKQVRKPSESTGKIRNFLSKFKKK
jgi:predicted PurR-regulated permease PerM